MGSGEAPGVDPGSLPLPPSLAAARAPVALVLDDVQWLADPESASAALLRLWTAVRAQSLPLFLILVGTAAGIDRIAPPGGDLAEAANLDLALGPLSPQEVARSLAGWSPRDRLLAWAAFGGLPGHARHLDAGVRLATNVQRAILDPAGPLHRAGAELLSRTFQRPERYAALVRGLARGARDWGELRAAVPELSSSSQVAPYVSSLEEHGLVAAERSLDARPRSRARRYRLTDPFSGFWYRCVLPRLGALVLGDPAGHWRELRADLDAWGRAVFPLACRAFLTSGAEHVLPAAAREVGGLWGEGYDLPVAGTLRNGAPLYGLCVWDRMADPTDADRLRDQVRATRYGFGREARVRVIFAAGAVDDQLRRREAREDLLLVARLADVLPA